MNRIARYTLLVLMLLLVAMASALTAMRFAIHGREVAVPKLVGMSQSQAETAAHTAGLMLAVQNRFYSNEVAEGNVVSQVPPPGEKVRSGWVVRVAQSLGPQHADIPDLIGQSPRAAEINVRRRGLELGAVAVASLPGATAEEIVGQSPAANATGFVSPRISVLIAAPVVAPQFLMPSFIGKSLALASQQVEDAGFKLGEVSDFPIPKTGDGAGERAKPASIAAVPIVVKQNPAVGQKVPAGATISFQVAR
jgi:beta-lactam-binding protein with PASTA domain